MRTTVIPSGPLTGTRTSAPCGVRAVSAVPSWASSTDGVRAAGAPSSVPSGKKAVVARSPLFTARSMASSRARSALDPANIATDWASWRATDKARSSARERASSPSGTRNATSMTEAIASP